MKTPQIFHWVICCTISENDAAIAHLLAVYLYMYIQMFTSAQFKYKYVTKHHSYKIRLRKEQGWRHPYIANRWKRRKKRMKDNTGNKKIISGKTDKVSYWADV